jgi:hypothetical protein
MRALAPVPSRPSTLPIRASDHLRSISWQWARAPLRPRGLSSQHRPLPRGFARHDGRLRADLPHADRASLDWRAPGRGGAGGEMRPIASAALIVVHTRSHLLPSICASTITARRSRSSCDCGRSINRRSTPTWCARLLPSGPRLLLQARANGRAVAVDQHAAIGALSRMPRRSCDRRGRHRSTADNAQARPTRQPILRTQAAGKRFRPPREGGGGSNGQADQILKSMGGKQLETALQ